VRLADAPDGRSHVAKAVVDGQIYVIGGLLGGAAGSSATPTVQRFDPGSRLWSTADTAPQPLDHAAATAVAGVIYVFGGNFEHPTVAALRYEVASHRWTAVRAMPEPRAAGGAVTIGSVIYVAGGYGTRPDEPLASAYRYDPSVDTWEPLPPLPTPRQHVAMVAYRGQACVIGGGKSAGAASTAVECYDPGANRWSALPPLPTPTSDFDATTVGDLIVCAGGGSLQGQIVSIFDGTTWKRGPELAVNRYGVAVASVGRTVLVLQGASVVPPYPAGAAEALTLP
ncbi:MAG: kelch repeat-containing protein, partial [Anaerolineaceae bacterium]